MAHSLTLPPLLEALLRWVDARRGWLFVALLFLDLAGFSRHWLITPDGAIHLNVARSLVESHTFASPTGAQTRINPGLPYVIAFLFRLFGPDAFWAVNLFILLMGLAALALSYWLFLLRAGRPLAVFLTLLLGCSWNLYYHSRHILADVPFLVGVLLFLIGMERMERPGRGHWWLNGLLLVSGVAVMAAFRIVVAAVLAAAVLYLFYRVWRSPRRARCLGVGALVLAVAVAAWLLDPRRPSPGKLMPKEQQVISDLLLNLPTTLHTVVTDRIPNMLAQETTKALYGVNMGKIISWLFAVPLLACGVALTRRHVFWGLLVALFLLYTLLFYFEHRYFLAVQPLWIYAIFLGALWFANLFHPDPGWWRRLVRRVDAGNATWPWRLLRMLRPWGFLKAGLAGRLFVYMLILYLLGNLSQIGRTIWIQRQSDPLLLYDGGTYAGLPQFGRGIQSQTPPGAVLVAGLHLPPDRADPQNLPPELVEPLIYLSRRRIVQPEDLDATQTAVYLILKGVEEASPVLVGRDQKQWRQPGPVLLAVPRLPNQPPWTLRRLDPTPLPDPEASLRAPGSGRGRVRVLPPLPAKSSRKGEAWWGFFSGEIGAAVAWPTAAAPTLTRLVCDEPPSP